MPVQIFVDTPLTEIRNKRNESVKKVCLLARLVTKHSGPESSAGRFDYENAQPALSAPFMVSACCKEAFYLACTIHESQVFVPHAFPILPPSQTAPKSFCETEFETSPIACCERGRCLWRKKCKPVHCATISSEICKERILTEARTCFNVHIFSRPQQCSGLSRGL